MTTVRDVIVEAMNASETGVITVFKRFLGRTTSHKFTDTVEAEQFIKNDIYNNIQMHLTPNVEMPVDVCGVLKFNVTPTMNSYTGDTNVGGSLNYANDTKDT